MAEILFLLSGRNVCSVRKLMFNVAERTNGMNCHLKQRPVGWAQGRREGEEKGEVWCRTRRGSYLNCTNSLKQARGKESPMQRQKMILRYHQLNCLGSNSSWSGLKYGAHWSESTQWTELSKGVHTSQQSLTCNDFHGFYMHRKLYNA